MRGLWFQDLGLICSCFASCGVRVMRTRGSTFLTMQLLTTIVFFGYKKIVPLIIIMLTVVFLGNVVAPTADITVSETTGR